MTQVVFHQLGDELLHLLLPGFLQRARVHGTEEKGPELVHGPADFRRLNDRAGVGAAVHQIVHQGVDAVAARLAQERDRARRQVFRLMRPARRASSISWLM